MLGGLSQDLEITNTLPSLVPCHLAKAHQPSSLAFYSLSKLGMTPFARNIPSLAPHPSHTVGMNTVASVRRHVEARLRLHGLPCEQAMSLRLRMNLYMVDDHKSGSHNRPAQLSFHLAAIIISNFHVFQGQCPLPLSVSLGSHV